MIVSILLAIVAAAEFICIIYLLDLVRVYATQIEEEDEPLAPATPSLRAKIKVFGDSIERWDADAYDGASEFQD